MTNPADYYENNVSRSIRLLEVVRKYQPEAHFIFASSAATYGNPNPSVVPLREDGPTVPISPYGWSKLMFEQVLADYAQAYGSKYTAFRFFNVCGADPIGRHGQEKAATHIIARYLESVINKKEFVINGNDFATPDGTCVRDYIHVADIASAIRVAIEEGLHGVYNIGTNHGASNLEVVRIAEQVTGTRWSQKFGPQRLGDPALLTASADKLMQDSSWRPKYDLYKMIEHAWEWYKRDVV
jgi:UDP-glucose 4-epimerase